MKGLHHGTGKRFRSGHDRGHRGRAGDPLPTPFISRGQAGRPPKFPARTHPSSTPPYRKIVFGNSFIFLGFFCRRACFLGILVFVGVFFAQRQHVPRGEYPVFCTWVVDIEQFGVFGQVLGAPRGVD